MYVDGKMDSEIISRKRIFTASKLREISMKPESGRRDLDASLMVNNAAASTEVVTRVKPLRKNEFKVLSEHELSCVSRMKLFSEASSINEGTGDLRVLIAHAHLVDHLQTRHALHMRSERHLINEEYQKPSEYERRQSYERINPEKADYDSDGSGEDEYDSDEPGEDRFDNDRGKKEVAGIVVTERELENNNDDQNADDTNFHGVTFENDTDNDFVPMDIKGSRARRILSREKRYHSRVHHETASNTCLQTRTRIICH